MQTIVSAVCVILCFHALPTNAGRILIVTTSSFYSHQIIYQTISLALHKRGHEIVILTAIPLNNPILQNYTEIDVSYISSSIFLEYTNTRWTKSQMESNKQALMIIKKFTAQLYLNPEFKEIYRNDSGEKFDAVIIEALCDFSLFTIAHRFNAPLIGIMSLGIHNFQRYTFGIPFFSSHLSNWEVDTLTVEKNISFWQRLQNFIDVWNILYYWYITCIMDNREYVESDVPDIMEITKNMSILLVNENPILTHIRPEQPNAIFFSGIHIQATPPTLSKDLRRFLDEATEGFIYVSLGTTVSCSSLPEKILTNFIEVFSKLPYKIVWKFECPELPRKLDNVFISRWFPQQGILAHPNIRLFIYQGGLQSTEEAVHYVVPLLGIPIMFEQASRIQRLVSLGVAMYMKLNELNEERLNTAIHRIIKDKSYKERMAHVSELFKDRPYDNLENVIWWVEYVMRHKGIRHLRFSDSDKPWYQRQDMDVIAFLSTALFATTCVTVFVVFRLCRFAHRAFCKIGAT